MEKVFKKVTKIHLEDYLPATIEAYGHAIIHGDGNIYVDVEKNERGEPVQDTHQRSFIAKTFCGVGNEVAQYRVRFNSVKELPKTVEQLEKMLLDAKAKEAFEDGKGITSNSFKSIGGKSDKKEDSKNSKELEDLRLNAEIQAEENANLKAELEALKANHAKTADAEPKAAAENKKDPK